MEQNLIDELETPCIVIDMDTARKNAKRMQEAADAYHCKLRPHIKTHKMGIFARMQVEYGACGITCAKISEAEVMADQGMQDIFIAYPMVGEFRIQRSIRLSKRIKRLILAVDSLEGAKALNDAAAIANTVLEVRLEIDTGAKRTGVPYTKAVDLAVAMTRLNFINLTGIYTFKSLLYKGTVTTDNVAAAKEEGKLMSDMANMIRERGVPLQDVSAGSSPTGVELAKTGLVNEIRPGTYIFNDYMLYKENAAKLEEIAARFYATVVSTPADDFAVIDGGTKTFPTDVPLNAEPYYYPGYAIVEGYDHLVLSRLNEEHGIIVSQSGPTGLNVGQKISLIPIHICTAINMQNDVCLLDNGHVVKQLVDARGMLV